MTFDRHSEEMTAGYFDGLDPESPVPGPNRSACYRHGFANGRDDLRHKPRAPAHVLREAAAVARAQDEEHREGRTRP